MKYRSTPFKQVTKMPGYDKQGRKGTITLNKSTSSENNVDLENYDGDGGGGDNWQKNYDRCLANPMDDNCSGYVKYEPAINKKYNELLNKESQTASFTPDTQNIPGEPGKPGTMVDTSTAPSYRGISRTGKKAGKDVRRSQVKLSKFADFEYNDDGSVNMETVKMKDGLNARQKAKFNERLGEYKHSMAGRDRVQATADAGKDPRNTAEFEYGTKMTGPTEGTEGTTGDVMISEDEKASGNFTEYDPDKMNYENQTVSTSTEIMSNDDNDKKDDSSNKMKSSAFKMKYSHSPNKMYKQAKEKSSALKMWGNNKVEDGNKLFFDKSLFKAQNKATRPMTNRASAFKMKGYNK